MKRVPNFFAPRTPVKGLLLVTGILSTAPSFGLELVRVALPTHDIVYDPLQTPLLEAASARGNVAVDGLGMLLHQARVGFTAWFGVEPAVDDALRRHVAKDLMEHMK